MATISELSWQALTAAVDEIKSPNRFLQNLVFTAHESKDLEVIGIDVVKKGRKTAPLVRKNGEAVLVGGYDVTYQTVEAPNIRIKRPTPPSDLLSTRRAGTAIQPDPASLAAARAMHIAREQRVLADMVTNTTELLEAQAIQGKISYSLPDNEVITITFPKPAANKIDLVTKWDDADASKPTIETDFKTAKRVINDAVGLSVTDVILGQSAADAFDAVMKKQFLGTWGGPGAVLQVGSVTFVEQFSRDGVIFMGTFAGVRVWEYSRTADVDGTDTPMIRDEYAEFLAIDPAAENVLYFGAIPENVPGGIFVGERFSKSWEEEDPAVRYWLLHSRPLPVQRRPASGVSMKVTS